MIDVIVYPINLSHTAMHMRHMGVVAAGCSWLQPIAEVVKLIRVGVR